MEKTRSGLLKFLFILTGLGFVIAIFGLFYGFTNPDMTRKLYGELPSWYPIYGTIGVVWGVISLYGIWTWKKWGVYMLIISAALTPFFNYLLLKQGLVSSNTLFAIIVPLLWFYAIYKEWDYFT